MAEEGEGAPRAGLAAWAVRTGFQEGRRAGWAAVGKAAAMRAAVAEGAGLVVAEEEVDVA